MSSPKISSSFPLISPFQQNLPFLISLIHLLFTEFVDILTVKLVEWLENLFSLQHLVLIWMQVDAMDWLTNLQHLFFHNCLKLNDRSVEISTNSGPLTGNGFKRKLFEVHTYIITTMCVVSYLKLNLLLFSDTLH